MYGLLGNIEQGEKLSFTSTTGEKWVRTWKSVNYSFLYHLYLYYKANGATCDIEQGAISTLTVDVWGEEPEYSYDILTEPQGIDIIYTTNFQGLTHQEIYAINNFFDTFKGTSITTYPDGITTDLAKKAWLLKLRGQNNYTLPVPVFRSQYVVKNDYAIPNALSYTNRVHSKATLVAAESIPVHLWQALEDSSTQVITDLTFPVNLTFLNGWLKSRPQIVQTGNKIQVTTEYRYASYSQDVYGVMV